MTRTTTISVPGSFADILSVTTGPGAEHLRAAVASGHRKNTGATHSLVLTVDAELIGRIMSISEHLRGPAGATEPKHQRSNARTVHARCSVALAELEA